MAFSSADAARARYNEIASGLLGEDPTGTKFGHNQIGLGANNQFAAFDLKYKNGDPNALKQQGSSVANALNSLVTEFGLDPSKIEAQKVGDYEALGSVRHDPGAGVTTTAKQAFDNIFNKYLKGQFDAKMGSYGTPAPAGPPKAAAAPVAPLGYGQPKATPQPQQPVIPPEAMGSNMTTAVATAQPMAPQQNMTPGTAERPTPGWQAPERRYNDLPTGPAIAMATPRATSGRDPYMEYLAPVYRPVTQGDAAYDQMGLDLMARYGFGAEHQFFPNSGNFKI